MPNRKRTFKNLQLAPLYPRKCGRCRVEIRNKNGWTKHLKECNPLQSNGSTLLPNEAITYQPSDEVVLLKPASPSKLFFISLFWLETFHYSLR